MAKDKLYFQDETEDIIALSYIAEQAGWTWLETSRQAKITAIGHTISTKRLQQSRQSLPKEKNDLTGQERGYSSGGQNRNPVCISIYFKGSA